MQKAPPFVGTSDPTRGHGGKTSMQNPTGKNLKGMPTPSNAMMGDTNQATMRNANQGSAGGPNFIGSAGNPVNRGKSKKSKY